MSNALKKMALAATLFVHFTNPATGEQVFADNPETGEPDESKPVGVTIYGPGSREYKKHQSAITQEAIDAKRKKVSAALLESNAVELLARCTSEFRNFDYEGAAASVETNRKFYKDPEYAHLRAQVEDKLGDFGAFLPSA